MMRSWLRRLSRALGLCLGLLLCGALVGLALCVSLSRGLQRERLRAWVESALAQSLELDVSLGALRGPLYPELELHDLALLGADGLALDVERIRIRCAFACGLSTGELELLEVEFTGPRLRLTDAPAEPAAGPSPEFTDAESTGTGLPISIRIRSLALARAELFVPASASGASAGSADREPTRFKADGVLSELLLTAQHFGLPQSGQLSLRANYTTLESQRLRALGR